MTSIAATGMCKATTSFVAFSNMEIHHYYLFDLYATFSKQGSGWLSTKLQICITNILRICPYRVLEDQKYCPEETKQLSALMPTLDIQSKVIGKN